MLHWPWNCIWRRTRWTEDLTCHSLWTLGVGASLSQQLFHSPLQQSYLHSQWLIVDVQSKWLFFLSWQSPMHLELVSLILNRVHWWPHPAEELEGFSEWLWLLQFFVFVLLITVLLVALPVNCNAKLHTHFHHQIKSEDLWSIQRALAVFHYASDWCTKNNLLSRVGMCDLSEPRLHYFTLPRIGGQKYFTKLFEVSNKRNSSILLSSTGLAVRKWKDVHLLKSMHARSLDHQHRFFQSACFPWLCLQRVMVLGLPYRHFPSGVSGQCLLCCGCRWEFLLL